MKKLNKIRLPLDIMMTLVSIVLMGGNYLFPADIVHEILGAALFVLWGVHIFFEPSLVCIARANNFGMTNCTKSFHAFFLPCSAFTVFTSSSPGEFGNILF